MNEKSDQNSDKVSCSSEENIFLPNVSSDNNANQSGSKDLKKTGSISKSNISLQNSVNGVTEHKLKANNNLPENPIKNGKANFLKDLKNNSACLTIDKQGSVNTFDVARNGFSYSNRVQAIEKSVDMGHSYMNGTITQNESEDLTSTSLHAEPSSSCSEKNKLSSVLSNNSQHIDSDDYSSDTGNDELSCCDDCCIYTYKGDIADLPSSFMNLDQQENVEDGSRAGSRGSSPEMDFLEMDFDPGPSRDTESDESSVNIDLKDCDNLTKNGDNFIRSEIKHCSEFQKKEFAKEPTNHEPQPSTSKVECNNYDLETDYNLEPKPSCSKSDINNCYKIKPSYSKSDGYLKEIFPSTLNHVSSPLCSKSESNIFINDPQNNFNTKFTLKNIKTIEQNVSAQNTCEQIIKRNENSIDSAWIPKNPTHRTITCKIIPDSKGHHSSSGDLIFWSSEITLPTNSSEGRLNTSSSLYHSTMEKKLVLDKQPSNLESFIEKTMIWTEQEAGLKQITQISTSACGATAVINVLKALGHEIPPNEIIIESVPTRLRANTSPLLKYLQSRSIAGSTHEDLIFGLQKLTDGQVYTRFFHMFPERYMNLSLWLSFWIKKGAIPIATLNLQKGISPGGIIPDAWHHQMIFGVGPHGIYMTNPMERVEEGLLWHQLTSESELLIRREDIISRFDYKSLKEMMSLKDIRWKRLNVGGQTANVVREHRLKCKILSRTHVRIPASYEAGITLAINVSNPAFELLRTCPELPILGTLP